MSIGIMDESPNQGCTGEVERERRVGDGRGAQLLTLHTALKPVSRSFPSITESERVGGEENILGPCRSRRDFVWLRNGIPALPLK